MDKHITYTYQPDYAVSPGKVLAYELEGRGMTQQELAKRTGLTTKHLVSIVKAKAAITPATAIKFERAIGMPAEFWLNLETRYQEVLARLADEAKLERDIIFLLHFPVEKMIKIGWIPKRKEEKSQLIEILRFFGLAEVKQWANVWRFLTDNKRQQCLDEIAAKAASAWLRRGEIEASWIPCETYSRQRFRRALFEIRALTTRGPEVFVPKMRRLCADSGVAVVFVPPLSTKVSIHGCTRWLNSNKALIQLCLKDQTDDHLWFAFLHGAAHILLHRKKEVFLEGLPCSDEKKESDANEFVERETFPKDEYARFANGGQFTEKSILSFATQFDIAPGIVVGLLQRHGNVSKSALNHLKKEFRPRTMKTAESDFLNVNNVELTS